MSVRIDQKKEIYSLYQLSDRGVKPTNAYSLKAVLRELKEETGLRIHFFKSKWLDHNEKYDCDIQYMVLS